MATAVAPTRVTFDPHCVGLGAEVGSPKFYFGESPFGAIVRAERANGTIYAVYTTEHTSTSYLDEMWAELPQRGLNFYTSLRCKKVPPVFGSQAGSCFIHYYATHKRGLLIGINKAQFFSAQGVL